MIHIIRLFITLSVLAISSQCLATANPEFFPRPAAIEPAVKFWTRVFTEVDTQGGFIHDDRYLGVVYESITLPNSKNRRTKQRYVNNIKKHYITILKKLARGTRKGLSKEERRVLDLWPKNVSNKTLKTAVNRIRFQLGQSDKYREGLIRSGAWKPHILKTLDEMGLPKEIASLPHVESSFNPKAYSRIGAAGLWQFTRSTGRRFMRIDHVVDERMDPFKASISAARLLENNYSVTGTWPLALTAYNHGAAGMRNAARQTGTTDIDKIIKSYRSRTFKFASRNFYVAFLAAVDVEHDAEKYFGPLTLNPEIKDGIISMPAFMEANQVANALGVSVNHLKQKNPALRPSVWNGNKYIPRGYKLRYDKSNVSVDATQAIAKIASTHMFAKQKPDLFHRIRRGQTLSTIAARYGVSVREIVALNGLRSKHRIRAGQVIRLPQPGGRRAVMLASSKKKQNRYPLPLPSNGKVTVKRGDTVTRIAKRYGLTSKQLLAYNDLRSRSKIYPGQSLSIKPKPILNEETVPVAIASAEITSSDSTQATVDDSDIDASANDNNINDELDSRLAENLANTVTATINTDRKESENTSTLPSTTLARQDQADSDSENAAAEPATIETDINTDVPAEESSDPETVALLESKQQIDDEKLPLTESINSESPEQNEALINDDASIETPDTQPEASQLDPNDPSNPLIEESSVEELPADPSDYSVAKNGTIEVQAAETLGHYAEWLNIRASQLRRINRMRYRTPLVIGKRIKLSFKKVNFEEFEHQRKEYHRILQEAFFEQNEITGKDQHKIRRGDSIWTLAKRKYHVPIWLLRQYNPDVSFQKIRPGIIITFPKVEQRGINQSTLTNTKEPTGNTKLVSKNN